RRPMSVEWYRRSSDISERSAGRRWLSPKCRFGAPRQAASPIGTQGMPFGTASGRVVAYGGACGRPRPVGRWCSESSARGDSPGRDRCRCPWGAKVVEYVQRVPFPFGRGFRMTFRPSAMATGIVDWGARDADRAAFVTVNRTLTIGELDE